MINVKHRLLLCAVLYVGILPIQLHAEETNKEKMWAKWLLDTTNQLPMIKALENRNNAAEWDYQAGKKALYNPELELSYEDNDAEEVGIGISHTFDFSGKRKANSAIAEATYTSIKAANSQLREDVIANALHALIAYEEAESLLLLAQEQERILKNMHQILVKRQAVGDVSQLDVDLTLLSLSENLLQISELEIAYNQAKSKLYTILGIRNPVFSLPAMLTWQSDIIELEKWIDQSPVLIAAQQTVSAMKAEANLSKANKRIDPTIGLSATSEKEEDYLGLSVSFPINVRNSYNAEYKASQERALQAELELATVRRTVISELEEKMSNYRSQLKHWKTWQSLNASSAEESRKLIEKQWSLGDISTSEYLFVLQQQGNALLAGLQLESGLKNAWVDWLLNTQQTEVWLTNLAGQQPQLAEKNLRK